MSEKNVYDAADGKKKKFDWNGIYLVQIEYAVSTKFGVSSIITAFEVPLHIMH